MEKLKQDLPVIVIAVIIVGVIWYNLSLWDECLGNNSFFYCARVLGK